MVDLRLTHTHTLLKAPLATRRRRLFNERRLCQETWAVRESIGNQNTTAVRVAAAAITSARAIMGVGMCKRRLYMSVCAVRPSLLARRYADEWLCVCLCLGGGLAPSPSFIGIPQRERIWIAYCVSGWHANGGVASRREGTSLLIGGGVGEEEEGGERVDR